jgi:4'-phosphopantetheinyl transferase superfamily
VAELTATVPGVCWDRVLFCVKESVYKAWFPKTGRWLVFEEACVDFDPASQSFTARLLVTGPGHKINRRHSPHNPHQGATARDTLCDDVGPGSVPGQRDQQVIQLRDESSRFLDSRAKGSPSHATGAQG